MSDEKVIIVDESNRIIGDATRAEMRRKGLYHRAVYLFIANEHHQLYVQERTVQKDIYPGYFDPASGGVVAKGESYEEAAYRELQEEMGITGITLTPRFCFYFQENQDRDRHCRVWGQVYTGQYNGDIVLQEEEVADVVMETPEQVLKNSTGRMYTPDSITALKRLVNELKL
ncbi:putative Nudix hydrolase YfcD [invertebrate metagenome]|uniref:Putative Nudix hydrolase YfcD n=1 Tax=invertebrate metagenome TaxID=1711999 RepID=A0A2H9T627_9ZZZZ